VFYEQSYDRDSSFLAFRSRSSIMALYQWYLSDHLSLNTKLTITRKKQIIRIIVFLRVLITDDAFKVKTRKKEKLLIRIMGYF